MFATTPPPPLPPNLITFTIPTPSAPLFLRTLQISGLPLLPDGSIGNVTPGTAGSPATHAFRMGAKFQQIRLFLMNNQGPLAIQITYDNVTFIATDMNPIAMQFAMNMPVVQADSAQLA
jgi:hypothetical protein